MTKYPLVSIIMNCFNGEQFLNQAIKSVLEQDYKNWEVIFWDNRSTDKSKDIVLSYNDIRIKYFNSADQTNLGKARENAYNVISGDYVGFLDVDDIWMKNKLSKQIEYFRDESVGICYSNTIFFSNKHQQALYKNKVNMNDSTGKLITNYHISLETVLLRVNHIKRLDKAFDNDFSHIADFDLITRLSTQCKIAYCPEILGGWRIHGTSEGHSAPERFNSERKKWVQKNIDNEIFKIHKDSILELNRLVLANIRMQGKYNYNLKPGHLLTRYSSLRNFLYVAFSMIPIIPQLLMKIKDIIYYKKWIES